MFFKLPPETNEDEQVPITANEELADYQPDGINDQQEDILPPKPKLQPIIAPDMFPPFVCEKFLTKFLIKYYSFLDRLLLVIIQKIILNHIVRIRKKKN